MKTFAHYSNSADPSDGYSNHPDNAPETEEQEQECSNCGELGFIRQKQINGLWIEYCNNCEHELN